MDDDRMMITRLRTVLNASDNETKTFLQPLLGFRGVQDLLITFLQDKSRSFEDWVWDPHVRQTLLNVRAMEPQVSGSCHDIDQWYAHAVEKHMAAMKLQNGGDVTSSELLLQADATQNDGKIKFQKKNYYAAKNAFQKSLEALLQHQWSEYYGKNIPVSHWDDLAMQLRYVTLCNNLAICGIKLKDLSLLNKYATKALSVDPTSTKALYAMTKLRLLEHRYHEANEMIEKALTVYPDKAQFLNLRKEIKAIERKEALKQAEIAEIRATQLRKAMAAAATTANTPTLTQEEREQQLKQDMQKRVDETPLPTRENDTFAATRLHVYFMKLKQRLMIDIRPCYNPDIGEEALFDCTIVNGTTGEVLAGNVKGKSKKIVKNEACKIAIEKLWNDKQMNGRLTTEDLAYLESIAAAVPVTTEQVLDSSPQLPTRISWLERQLQPLALLNQLTQRGILQTCFDIEDVSPSSKEVTEFKCLGYLNGEHVATATAISKKKARAEAAQAVLANAFEKNLLIVYNGTTGDSESVGGDEVSTDLRN